MRMAIAQGPGPTPAITNEAVHTLSIPLGNVEVADYDINEVAKPFASFFSLSQATLGVELEVSVNTLDVFQVRFKHSEDGEWIIRASAAADFTTPNAPVLATSGDLTVAAAGTHWLSLDVRGTYAVQLWAASGNAAGSTIIARGSFSR